MVHLRAPVNDPPMPDTARRRSRDDLVSIVLLAITGACILAGAIYGATT